MSAGYRKPPRDKQFKPGQSGNPGGRPKKSTRPSLIDDVEAVLAEPTSFGTDRVRRQYAVAQAVVAAAQQGDLRAISLLLAYCPKGSADDTVPTAEPSQQSNREATADFIDREFQKVTATNKPLSLPKPDGDERD